MKYLITAQIRNKPHISYKIIIFGIVLISMFLVSSCKSSGEPSDEQIEHAEKAVSDIRASLYTPDDAELLAERLYHGSNPELYPGCVSGHVYLAYHSPRPFDEILDEYRTVLTKGGWEPRPGYPHNDQNFDYFQLGTQTILLIDSSPIREDLLVVPTPSDPNKQKDTIYYIRLLYYEPSIRQCSEM